MLVVIVITVIEYYKRDSTGGKKKSLHIRPVSLNKYKLSFTGRGVINIWQNITYKVFVREWLRYILMDMKM